MSFSHCSPSPNSNIFSININTVFILLAITLVTLIKTKMATESCKIYADSCQSFSSKLYSAIAEEEKVSNIVSSPLSVHLLLCYLTNGADGQTVLEMINNLFISNIDQLHVAYHNFISDLNIINEAELHLANAIFIHNDIELMEAFSNLGKDFYKFTNPQINLKDNNAAANLINDWILENTNKQLADVIKPEDINDDTKVILVNAIYFKGLWQYPFDPEKNVVEPFYTSKKNHKIVSMMVKKARFLHGKLPMLKAQFLQLPYTDKNLNMMVVLPDEIDGLFQVEKNFDWNLIINAESSNRQTNLHLPKFKIEYKTVLNDILSKIGLQFIFEDSANFSKMSTTPLKVGQVIQKAFIQVNEKGSEAAAATVVKMVLKRSLQYDDEFFVNRPFMIIIHHIPSNIPLFIASVRDIIELSDYKKDEL